MALPALAAVPTASDGEAIFSAHQVALIDGYFELRQQSEKLRGMSHLFEGQKWVLFGDMICRGGKDGYELRVYQIEGEIEACIIAPNGESWTFS